MRALITGRRGFCGRHLAEFLTLQGVEVYGISHRGEVSFRNYLLPDPTDWKILAGIMTEVDPDYVFHLAGISAGDDPTEFYLVNCQYAISLFRALEQAKMEDRPVLLVGTAAEYGDIRETELPITENLPPRPYNHYGVSKLAQTLAGGVFSRNHSRVVRVRPFNVIGPGMPEHLAVPDFAKQIMEIKGGKKAPALEVGNLEPIRDFLGIKDLVRIYWQLVRTPAAYGEIVNVCSGRGTRIREVVETLIRLGGYPLKVRINSARIKAIDIPVHYGSIRKLEKILGWTPALDLEPILREMLEP